MVDCSTAPSDPFDWLAPTDFRPVDIILCTFDDTVGLIVAGTIVWVVLMLVLYQKTGGVETPAVVTVLLGGGATSQIAPPALGAVVVLILGAVAALAVRTARRLER